MKEGKLVESGTHRELIQQNGEYHKLYDIQARAFVDTPAMDGSQNNDEWQKFWPKIRRV